MLISLLLALAVQPAFAKTAVKIFWTGEPQVSNITELSGQSWEGHFVVPDSAWLKVLVPRDDESQLGNERLLMDVRFPSFAFRVMEALSRRGDVALAMDSHSVQQLAHGESPPGGSVNPNNVWIYVGSAKPQRLSALLKWAWAHWWTGGLTWRALAFRDYDKMAGFLVGNCVDQIAAGGT